MKELSVLLDGVVKLEDKGTAGNDTGSARKERFTNNILKHAGFSRRLLELGGEREERGSAEGWRAEGKEEGVS